MGVGSGGSPRNLVTGRRDSVEQNYGRYPSGSFEGPHSLPYTLGQQYQDGTVYQEVLPSQGEVVRRTEAITRCIQELLISAKAEKVLGRKGRVSDPYYLGADPDL